MDGRFFLSICIIICTTIIGISYAFYAMDWTESSLLSKKQKRKARFYEMYYALTATFAYPVVILGTEQTGLRLLCLMLIIGTLGTYCYMEGRYPRSQRKTTSFGDNANVISCIAVLIYIIAVIAYNIIYIDR